MRANFKKNVKYEFGWHNIDWVKVKKLCPPTTSIDWSGISQQRFWIGYTTTRQSSN
jgi:hypothetical protein